MDGYEEYGRGYRAHAYSQQIHYDGLHGHVEEYPEPQWDDHDYSNHFDDPMWGDDQPLHEEFTIDRHFPNTKQGVPQHNTIIDLLSQLLDQQKETDERLNRIVDHQKMTENQLAQIASEREAKENSKEAIGDQSTKCSRKSEQLGKPSPSPNAELIEDVKGITLKSGKILPPPLEKSDLETPRREMEGGEQQRKEEEIESRTSMRQEKKEEPTATRTYIPRIPFPQRLDKNKLDAHFKKFAEMLKKLYVTLPFHEVITQNPTYAKFLKDIVSNRRTIEESSVVALDVECSAIVQSRMPKKMGDNGSFSIPISIGKVGIDNALCDLGASISLIPFSLFEKIDMGELHPTAITLRLADRSSRIPKGVLRDIPIKVGKFFIPVDFYVLEMDDERETPVILGRPFLNTVEAVISCGEGSIELKIGNEKLKFYLKNALNAPNSTFDCNFLDVSYENFELTPFESEVLEKDDSRTSFTSLMSTENEELHDLAALEEEGALESQATKSDPILKGKEFEGELKPLPSNLRYEFLGPNSSLPVIIGSHLNGDETIKLLDVLRKNRKALGYVIDDIKGISPTLCMHRIKLYYPSSGEGSLLEAPS